MPLSSIGRYIDIDFKYINFLLKKELFTYNIPSKYPNLDSPKRSKKINLEFVVTWDP